jgi:hypothetical protein
VVQLSEGRFSTPESGSGLRFYYGREGMRKNRHVWAARDEHVTVHRSGGGRGGGDTSGLTLLLWGAGIIAGIILLYYLWDVIQVLIVLMILGTAARLLLRK